MAKYEDYAKKEGELEDEIDNAAEQAQTREGESGFTMPDRFQGKSAEDIAQSYTELESLNSRQAQDLGTMRQTVDELVNLQSQQEEPAPAAEPITVDDLYDDPNAAVERAVEAATGGRIEALEQELAKAKLSTRVEGLESKFPGWKDTVRSDEFTKWAQASPYRLRMAQAADGWDMDAADELLGMYSEVTGRESQSDQDQRNADLQNATLESSSAEVLAGEPGFSRSELLQHRVAAKHGNQESIAYMDKNAEAIAIAYENGAITD